MPHVMMSASSAAAARRARKRAQLRAELTDGKQAPVPQPQPERPPSPVYPNPDNACLMTICLNCVPNSSSSVRRLNRIVVISNWIFIALVFVSVILMLCPFFGPQDFLQGLRTFGYVVVGLALFGILVNAIFLRRMLYSEIRKMSGENTHRVRRSNEVTPVNTAVPPSRPASALPKKTQPPDQAEDAGRRPLPPLLSVLPPPAASKAIGVTPPSALPAIGFAPSDQFRNNQRLPPLPLSPRSLQDDHSAEMWPPVNPSRIHLPPLRRPETQVHVKPRSGASPRAIDLSNHQEITEEFDSIGGTAADLGNPDSFQSKPVPDDTSESEDSDATPDGQKKAELASKPVYTSSEEDEL